MARRVLDDTVEGAADGDAAAEVGAEGEHLHSSLLFSSLLFSSLLFSSLLFSSLLFSSLLLFNLHHKRSKLVLLASEKSKTCLKTRQA